MATKNATDGRATSEGTAELRRIVDLLERAGSGDAWHGPSIDATLASVTAQQAAERPLAHGHTIWELVLHIAVWERTVARRLAGEEIEPTPAEDWPLMPAPTETAWRSALADLRRARSELREAMLAFDESRLGAIVQGKSYPFYVMLHGIVQHDLYHAGQIAVLRKAHS
jgi:uncharacterized damage-inducible protein DinB